MLKVVQDELSLICKIHVVEKVGEVFYKISWKNLYNFL